MGLHERVRHLTAEYRESLRAAFTPKICESLSALYAIAYWLNQNSERVTTACNHRNPENDLFRVIDG